VIHPIEILTQIVKLGSFVSRRSYEQAVCDAS